MANVQDHTRSDIIVAGRVLDNKKHLWIALSSAIYGIGKTRAYEICKGVGIDPTTLVSSLSDDNVQAIRSFVSNYVLEGDLRRQESTIMKMLQSIGCYRGIRSRRGLPRRGQRTKTNARTAKNAKRRTSSKA